MLSFKTINKRRIQKKSSVCVRQETYWAIFFFFFSNITYRFISHEMLKQFQKSCKQNVLFVKQHIEDTQLFWLASVIGTSLRRRQGVRHGKKKIVNGQASLLFLHYRKYYTSSYHIISYHILTSLLGITSQASPFHGVKSLSMESYTFTRAVFSLTYLIPSLERQNTPHQKFGKTEVF